MHTQATGKKEENGEEEDLEKGIELTAAVWLFKDSLFPSLPAWLPVCLCSLKKANLGLVAFGRNRFN